VTGSVNAFDDATALKILEEGVGEHPSRVDVQHPLMLDVMVTCEPLFYLLLSSGSSVRTTASSRPDTTQCRPGEPVEDAVFASTTGNTIVAS